MYLVYLLDATWQLFFALAPLGGLLGQSIYLFFLPDGVRTYTDFAI